MDTVATRFLCPVCGFDLGFPAWDGDSPSDEICPSCGIQFGYNDARGATDSERRIIYTQWREQWMDKGMPWCGASRRRPPEWDPIKQLARIGVTVHS